MNRRTVDSLVARVRRETGNASVTNVTSAKSILDIEILDYLNDGQELVQELITSMYSKLFRTVETIPTVPATESYWLTSDAFLSTRIICVEWKRATDSNERYQVIRPADVGDRLSRQSSYPMSYIREGKKIILNPMVADAGTLRVTYERNIKSLYKRVATITSSTDVGNVITFNLDAATVDSIWDELVIGNSVKVIDADGVQVLADMPIVTKSNYVLTFDGTSLAAVPSMANKFLFLDNSYTNISELPKELDKMMVAHAVWMIFSRTSNKTGTKDAKERLGIIQESIRASYMDEDRDIQEVPQDEFSNDY